MLNGIENISQNVNSSTINNVKYILIIMEIYTFNTRLYYIILITSI